MCPDTANGVRGAAQCPECLRAARDKWKAWEQRERSPILTKPGVVRSIYDPTAGTGGMLSIAGEHLEEMNLEARPVMYGQELNPESYAICKADMLIKGQDIGNIILGNTLSADGLHGKRFDYMLSNPPFGVEWKKIEKENSRPA